MSVLVYIENWDGKFKKLSFELISYARELANNLNTEVVALSIGNVSEDELKNIENYGASKILSVNDKKLNQLVNKAYASVVTEATQKEKAEIIVFANNNIGKAIAPRVSVKLKAGMAAGVTALPSSYQPFTISKKAFNANAFANVVIKSEVKILTLTQNSYEIIETDNKATIENYSPELSDSDFKTEVKDISKETGKILLTDAEIVVSGGRGMKGPENWAPLEELAQLLGAATACSRPVSDEGWRPHSEHTGQTGKIVAPNLYFALGISGAIQHLGGVSGSKCIVAVNTDPDASIFEAADYGIIGDVRKVLPDLIAAVKEAKG